MPMFDYSRNINLQMLKTMHILWQVCGYCFDSCRGIMVVTIQSNQLKVLFIKNTPQNKFIIEILPRDRQIYASTRI